MTQDVIASSAIRVVAGLGITGLSCARHLYRSGEAFCVVDSRAQPPGLEEMRREMPDVPVYLEEIPLELLESAAEIVVSPGIAMDDPLVVAARRAGVDVVGDVDLFMREARAPVVGITGSNAKSTVTELVGLMAQDAGLNAGVGGNLGTPALELLAPERELYVLELSSFQLERAGSLNLEVATVLNVSADHLDRHGDMPRYHQAKHRIFRGCRKIVVNRDDPLTVPLVESRVEIVSWRMGEPELGGFGLRVQEGREYLCRGFDPLLPCDELALAGRHNIANALAALAIGSSVGLATDAMIDTLRRFAGLPHRCQKVAAIDGVDYINDSKGTNTGATEAALNGLGRGRNVILVAGGQGKGADFDVLREAVGRHCKLVLLIGEAASQMQASLTAVAPTHIEPSLESAVASARHAAVPGDCVLLSPACASFDMFSGYVQRGEQFSRLVEQLREGGQ